MRLKEKYSQTYFLKHFLWRLALVVALFVVVFLIGIRQIVIQQKIELRANQKQIVLADKNLIEHLFKESILDLLTISESDLFLQFFSGKIADQEIEKSFNAFLLKLLENKEAYYQLRFLNTSGMEIFRLERRNNEPYFCLPKELQDKSHRYYYQEAIGLQQGQFYVSPFDLNIEHGELELPYRPMLRICAPVFNDKGERQGINVLNFDGTDIVQELDEHLQEYGGANYLINQDGYFLNAKDTAMEWGFMFENKKDQNITSFFSDDFQRINQMQQGQFESDRGLFTVSVIEPFGRLSHGGINYELVESYEWKLIAFVPSQEMTYGSFLPMRKLLVLFFFALALGVLLVFFYSKIAWRKLEAQQALIQSEEKLRIANETKDRFFSIVAHDLKNSSGTIANYLEFIFENYDDIPENERTVHLRDITFAASQHNKLLYEILDWARLQQGNVSFKPQPIRLKELLEEQLQQIDLQLKNKELVVEFDFDDEFGVFADRDMLKTIFRNLVNNAIKFSYRKSRIVIEGRPKAEQVELRVIDFGIGMREADADKIFDLSSKVQQPGTEKEAGTGFGLKLVAELVAINGGIIQVESELGKGSSFILNLPSGK
ncbi:sensor histidine kinase [Sunxiuqinia elliptica]